jgi:hypothetical protein
MAEGGTGARYSCELWVLIYASSVIGLWDVIQNLIFLMRSGCK